MFSTETVYIPRYTDEGEEYYRKSPIFIPDGKVRDIEFNGEKLTFDFYINEEGKNVDINGCSNVCREFAEHSILKFEEHLYTENNSGIRKLFTFSVDEGWKGKEIRVTKTFENTFLQKDIREKLLHDIDAYLDNQKLYEKMGIPYKRGYLFYGAPGTGKSSTVYAMSAKTDFNVYKISPKWFTASVFKDSILQIPPGSILLLEEIDTQVEKRKVKAEPEEPKEPKKPKEENSKTCKDGCCEPKLDLSEMLNVLDGYEALYNCIIVATTNYIKELDPALIRAGRFDLHIEFILLGQNDIKMVIEQFTEEKFDIKHIDPNMKITSSRLINEILLPNLDSPDKIRLLLNQK